MKFCIVAKEKAIHEGKNYINGEFLKTKKGKIRQWTSLDRAYTFLHTHVQGPKADKRWDVKSIEE